jgi:phosphoribosyl-AMP cyclohydrolase
MIVVMLDANYISERISSLKQEQSDLKVIKACYWRRSEHSAWEKSAHEYNQQRLLQIKRELADLMKRRA